MSERRWALLVGIDEYPFCPPELQLQGCVNDVMVWNDILTSPSFGFNFPAAGITLITNAQATHDGILAAFDELIQKAGPDDVVFTAYSGHGSQVPSTVPGEEGDNLDETIVPSDARNPADLGPRKDITDKQIHQKLITLGATTQKVTLVFDSCHSGSITRDLSAARVRQIPPDLRPASELQPSPPDSAPVPKPGGALPAGPLYTALSACRDEQLAHEYKDTEAHGALTWFLTRALTNARPGATYRDVFEQAAAGVAGAYPTQLPQIDGAVDRALFGVADFAPMRFLPVVSRAGNVATIGGGGAQTVDVGSHWTAYPVGTREPTPETQVGTLTVTAAAATTATATVDSETTPGAVTALARVVREGRKIGDAADALALRIGMEDDGSALAKLIDGSELLARVAPDDPAVFARVITIAPRAAAAATDPVPQLGALGEATVAVVGPDGQLLVPGRPAGDGATPQRVCSDLETFARYKRVLDLENPGSALTGAVDLELLRKGPDGSWIVAEPDPAAGKVAYQVGDLLGLRLTNNSSRAVYPAVLDLGLTYAVQVFPGCTGSDVLDPGVSLDLLQFNGSNLDVNIPDPFPFVPSDSGAGDSGVETLKLFLTSGPADYTFLEQAGVTRDIGLQQGDGGDDWATGIRQFLVRRAATTAALDPDGGAVDLGGGATLSSTGVSGSAATVVPGAAGSAGFGLSSDALDGVLGAESLGVQATIQMTGVTAEQGTRGIDTPAIEVTPPAPAPGQGQMLLVRDEAGVLSWHFADSSRGFGDEAPTYRIDRRVVVTPAGDPGTRGFASAIGTKLLKVVVFPLVEPAIGQVSDYFAGRWEAAKRPYRLRFSTPDDFNTPGGSDVQPADWAKLAGKKTLLLVHGTFSRSFSGFGRLPLDTFTALYQHYEGRVIALDHFTLSHTPMQNIEWLLAQMPDGASLDLDIVSHSRGGLVSRTLAEHQSELSLGSKRVSVGRVVMVASPNAGTALADANRLGDLIDTYTNVLNLIPDVGVTDILAGIVTVAKMIAVGAMNGLDGLTSMTPGGEFQKWLNSGPAPEGVSYRALSADHEPTTPGLVELAKDAAIDGVFAKQHNDLVVPTEGVFAANGAALFPIDDADRYVFDGAADVSHTTFFGNATTSEKLKEWLIGG